MARPAIDDDAILTAVARLMIRDEMPIGHHTLALTLRAGELDRLVIEQVVPGYFPPIDRKTRWRISRKFKDADIRDRTDLRLLAIDPRLPSLARQQPNIAEQLTEKTLAWLESMAIHHRASIKAYVDNLTNIWPTQN